MFFFFFLYYICILFTLFYFIFLLYKISFFLKKRRNNQKKNFFFYSLVMLFLLKVSLSISFKHRIFFLFWKSIYLSVPNTIKTVWKIKLNNLSKVIVHIHNYRKEMAKEIKISIEQTLMNQIQKKLQQKNFP
jgi:monomeric isocitrate dehydrogenase